MTKFNFFKKIKLSDKRFKIFIFSLFALFLLIPFFVFALNSVREGYKSLANNGYDSQPVFWNTTDNRDSISTSTGVCIINSSSNSYFVPTRTSLEWNAFASHLPAKVSLSSGYDLPGGTC